MKGYVRGFDVKTGKRLWIFHTIPMRGEFGRDTWEGNSADYTGNTGVWTQISVDEKLGLAYLPVELPTGDSYGGYRPGSGLFGETIVAVDLKPGSADGITSWCTTAYGTSTFRVRHTGGYHHRWPTGKSISPGDQAIDLIRVEP